MAVRPKRILIVGGGPSVLDCARLAKLLGHEVILCEKSSQLGGTLRFAALVYEPNERLLDWLEAQVRKLGVEIRLGTEVDAALIRELAPDEVLIAAGAKRSKPTLPGIDRKHVFDGDDLRALLTGLGDVDVSRRLSLWGRLAVQVGRSSGLSLSPRKLRRASKLYMPVGRQVVVIGGGLVGLELAEFLAERGRQITILEQGPKFGLEMAHPRRWRVLDDLRQLGVDLVPEAVVQSIEDTSVVYATASGEGPTSVDADTVILAVGLTAHPEIMAELKTTGVPMREIGDVGGVGYLEGAIRDGFHAALEL